MRIMIFWGLYWGTYVGQLPFQNPKELSIDTAQVMTLKFLNDAPAEPPKSTFAIFVGEKRLAVGP